MKRKGSFNLKLGYFTYAQRNYPKDLLSHFRNRKSTFDKLEITPGEECPREVYRNKSVRAETEMKKYP